jgi:hypothetical protein
MNACRGEGREVDKDDSSMSILLRKKIGLTFDASTSHAVTSNRTDLISKR